MERLNRTQIIEVPQNLTKVQITIYQASAVQWDCNERYLCGQG